MKILLIAGSFPPTKCGVGDYSYQLAKRLAKRNNLIEVLTTRNSQVLNFSFNIPNLIVYPTVKSWNFVSILEIIDFIEENHPDVVHLQYAGGPPYGDEIAICFLPILLKLRTQIRCPFVTTIHEIGAPFRNSNFESVKRRLVPIYRLLWKSLIHLHPVTTMEALGVASRGGHLDHKKLLGKLVNGSERIIVVDKRYLDWAREEFPQAIPKIRHIPVGMSIEMAEHFSKEKRGQVRESIGLEGESFLISFFGFIYREKGLETLLRAIKKINTQEFRDSNVYLIIIGGINDVVGDPRHIADMKDLAKRLGIDEYIFWTGYCRDEEVSIYLRSSDICVLPFEEGVSLKSVSFVTAISHGLPTIVTQGANIPTELISEENVLLVPPADPEALASAVQRLLRSPGLQNRLKTQSLQLAQSFSWENIIEQTMQVYLASQGESK